MCEVLAANDSVTPVKPFNLCVCPQGALWQSSARLFTLLLSCALARGAISSFRLILSNVKLDHLFPVFFIFLLFFFFPTTANPRSVHKEFRAWRTNRMRTDARLLSSLTTAFIECLAPPLLLTQLLAAAAAQLSVVEKHPFTQLQFFPPFFLFPTASFRHSEGQVCNLPAGTSSKFSQLKMFKFEPLIHCKLRRVYF